MRAEDKGDVCVDLYSMYMSKYNLAEPSILQESRVVSLAMIQLEWYNSCSEVGFYPDTRPVTNIDK